MTDERVSLSDEQIDHLADLVAIKVARTKPAIQPMLTVDEIARTFRVSRAWVYENAQRLGGIRLGPGQRAPLRFDLDKVMVAMQPSNSARQTTDTQPERERPARRSSRHLHPVYDG